MSYDPEEFTPLTDDAAILVRYKVEDGVGNVSYLNVYAFVSRNGVSDLAHISKYRSISGLYEGKDTDDGGISNKRQ